MLPFLSNALLLQLVSRQAGTKNILARLKIEWYKRFERVAQRNLPSVLNQWCSIVENGRKVHWLRTEGRLRWATR